MSGNDTLEFGATLNELGKHGSVGHSDCHNFGSVNGCRIDCPALQNGDCPEPDENREFINTDSRLLLLYPVRKKGGKS